MSIASTLGWGALAGAALRQFGRGTPCLIVSSLVHAAAWAGTVSIEVDASRVQKRLDDSPLGINLNYLADDDAERPAGAMPLSTVLRNMGMRTLRYPGGEKSDSYLWSVPPYRKPIPTLARTGPGEWPAGDQGFADDGGRRFVVDPLDFDEFMRITRESGSEPVVVVAFDSMFKRAAPGGRAPSRTELLDTAVAWVRYANVTRGYGVRYWELGNESYLRSAVNGAAPSARAYAKDAVLFARAMKAVDPSILIGVNGLSETWWDTVLKIAGDSVDFLSVHAYPAAGWSGGYKDYVGGGPAITRNAHIAGRAIEKAERRRRGRHWFIGVTELGAIGFDEQGWRNANDFAHGLALFDFVGRHLAMPRVRFVQAWGTRFPGGRAERGVATAPRATDMLSADNSPLAQGLALSIWGRFLGDELVHASAPPPVIVYASRASIAGPLTVLALNRGGDALDAQVHISGYAANATGAVWLYSGRGLDDERPTLRRAAGVVLRNSRASLQLPAYSVSVLTLEAG